MTYDYLSSDQNRAAITKAAAMHVISDHERRLVTLWWMESKAYASHPDIEKQPKWERREKRAQEIIDKAYATHVKAEG